MDFGYDDKTEDYRKRLLAFMDEYVYPAERDVVNRDRAERNVADGERGWAVPPVVARLQERARLAGLWNLFLPGEFGAGLTNVQYAPLAEITGRSPSLA